MASNERSLGWNTSTVNDGASTYDTARMIAMELKTLGNGTQKSGSQLFITGVTNTITIADGAALINGYFYETTAASTISTIGLNGTYTLALIANATGASYTVAANGAATILVLTSTVRMALCTSAQLTTIGAANYISYATVIVAATGLITSVTNLFPFAISRTNTNTQFVWLVDGSASLPTAGTDVTIGNFSSVNSYPTSNDNSITTDLVQGDVYIHTSGLYNFSASIYFDSNTTGTRKSNLPITNIYGTQISAASLVQNVAGTPYAVYQYSGTYYFNTVSPFVTVNIWAGASVASRSVVTASFMVTRL